MALPKIFLHLFSMPRPSLPAIFETRFSSVPWHHIAIECVCAHSALLPVSQALERLGQESTVQDMLDRLRCARCGARQVVQARIVYSGASGVAMSSASATNVHLPKPRG